MKLKEATKKQMKLKEATKKQNDHLGAAISSLERAKIILATYIQDKRQDDEMTLQAVGKEFGDIKESEITTDNAYTVISQIDDMILALIKSNDDDDIFTDDDLEKETIYKRK